MKSKDILIAAKKVILKYDWVQGQLACDELGRAANPTKRSACRFCVLGALVRAKYGATNDFYPSNMEEDLELGNVMHLLSKFLPEDRVPGVYFGIPDWNDDSYTTKKEVLNVLDQAIAAEV